MLALATCPPQAQGEYLPEYASRVLRHVIAHGPETLTRDQLAQAYHAAIEQLAALPKEPNQDQWRQYWIVVTAQRTIGEDQERRARAAAQDARMLAAYAAEQDAADDPTHTPGAAPGSQDDDRTRALRLLKAALVLVMQDDHGNGNGGHGSRLTPPPFTPTGPRTPSGAALAPHQDTHDNRRDF